MREEGYYFIQYKLFTKKSIALWTGKCWGITFIIHDVDDSMIEWVGDKIEIPS